MRGDKGDFYLRCLDVKCVKTYSFVHIFPCIFNNLDVHSSRNWIYKFVIVHDSVCLNILENTRINRNKLE